MPSYRMYFVDEERHINDVRQVSACDSDDAALEHAKQFADGHAVEVWERSRFIGLIGKNRKILRG